MNWLLPITLVLIAVMTVAAIHFVFMRWLARQPDPATIGEPEAPQRTDERESAAIAHPTRRPAAPPGPAMNASPTEAGRV